MNRDEISNHLKDIMAIDGDVDDIADIIKRLARLEPDSRQKILSTVQSYYEMRQVDWDEILQKSIERNKKEMEKLLQDGPPSRSPLRGAVPRYSDPEEVELRGLVKSFSEDMIQKMLDKKFNEGYTGWDENSICNIDELWDELKDHVEKGSEPDNLVDIANFCAFIWNLRRKA